MVKVVINNCYGGFSLSKEACELYAKKIGLNTGKWNETWKFFQEGDFYDRDIPRDDSVLVSIVEELGEKANGYCAELKIVEIPEDVEWDIHEYDGSEWVAEVHRTWR
jgi:Lhr-like helicase